MTTMIVEVYEALRAIDVPDDKAKAAAQALSQDLNREVATLGGLAMLSRGVAGFSGNTNACSSVTFGNTSRPGNWNFSWPSGISSL